MILGVAALSARAQEASHITWEPDFATAQERAKSLGKPLIAFFTFDTCHWCKVLEKETFTDAAVIAASRQLVWVEVNRDHTPELPERFHVQSYPALLILGAADENIHRFSGFKQPPAFLQELNDGLRRYELYRQGKEWSEPLPRAEALTDAASIVSWKAPLRELSHGITFLDEQVFLAQKETLYALDRDDGEVAYTIELPGLVTDLAADGHLVYAVTYGWSHGDPILVIDPAERRVVRRLVTEENRKNPESSTYGITWCDGRLFVLARGAKIHEVDAETGKIVNVIATPKDRLFGLDWDGQAFVTADDRGLLMLDREGRTLRTIPMNYPLRTVAFHAGHYFVMEQPVFGFDRQHESIMVWPKEMLVYDLTLNESK